MFSNSKANINNSLNKGFIYTFKLLNKEERLRLKKITFLSFLAGIIEIISVTTVYPLVSVIIEPDLIIENEFINQIFSLLGKPSQNQFVILLALGASSVLVTSVILNLLSQLITNRFASSAEERLAKYFYNNVIYSSYKWHILNNPNITRNLILKNINVWSKGILRLIPILAGQLSGILIAIITLIITTPRMGLLLFLFSVGTLIIILKFVRKKTFLLMQKVRERQAAINIFLTDSLNGIKDIKLSSNEENFIKKFIALNHVIIKSFSSATNWNTLPSFLVVLIGQLSILMTALALFLLGIRGGELAAIVAIVVLVSSKIIPLINKLGSSLNNISNYSGFTEEIFETLEIISKDQENISKRFANNDIRINNWNKINFEKVTFKYPKSSKFVLKNLNFEIKKGLHYALVGGSGAGKSTTIDILLGLLEPSKGKILIDEIDLKNFGVREWQKIISYVPQEPLISDASLRENIAFGFKESVIDDDLVYFCLEQTQLIKVLDSLENGIYTNLGNKGITLSGGQKQRVAIARALYKNSEILILDEATSSLDTKTEEYIQDTINNLRKKMTIIQIAHRLSSIKNCDCIFLLDNGQLKDKGSFKELNKSSQLFRDLSKTQIIDLD